jgi:hypothetical protein
VVDGEDEVSRAAVPPPSHMHMITPGIAASLTPTTIERRQRAPQAEQFALPAQAAPARAPRRRLRAFRLHLPGVHVPHGHA